MTLCLQHKNQKFTVIQNHNSSSVAQWHFFKVLEISFKIIEKFIFKREIKRHAHLFHSHFTVTYLCFLNFINKIAMTTKNTTPPATDPIMIINPFSIDISEVSEVSRPYCFARTPAACFCCSAV